MEKENTLFEELIGLYAGVEHQKYDSEIWVKTRIQLKEWKELPYLEGKIVVYSDVMNIVGEILNKFFKGDVQLLIGEFKKELDKERSSNEWAAKTYGSELAGDLDRKERELKLKIDMLSKIIEDE